MAGDPIVLMVGHGPIRRVGCVLVLVRVWDHGILYQKFRPMVALKGEGYARRRRRRRRSERSVLLRVGPNAVVASHTIDIWPRHSIALVLNLNARVQRGRI